MSEALRSIFAEFGFGVDTSKLDLVEKRVRDVVETTKLLPKATEDAAARTTAANAGAADGAEASAAKVEAAAATVAKPPKAIESYVDLVTRFEKALSSGIGGRLYPRIQQLGKSFPPLSAAMKRFGLDELDASSAGRVLAGATLATVLVLQRGIASAFAFADAFAQNAEQLRDTAREARVTSSELQQFQHAGTMSGVGAERMASGVAALGQSLRATELRQGGGVAWTLRRLGVEARDASGRVRPTADVMDDLSLAFEHVQSPARRARLAVSLFGAEGRRMLDVLHSGPGGLIALRREMEELGGGVTPEATEAARGYTQAQERLSRGMDSLRSVLATALLPALSWLVNKVAALEGYFARLTRGTHVVQIVLAALGVVGAAAAVALIAAWWPVIGPFLGVAAAIAAVVLIFDDLITFVEGGDSALGRFIDSMFGVGTSAEYAHELREEWEAVVDAVSRAIAAVAEFLHLGEAPAIGTLSAPRTDGHATAPAAGARARGASAGATRGAAARRTATVTAAAAASTHAVPATRAVAAAAPAGGTTVVRQTTRTVAPVFHITNPSPAAVATEVQRLMEEAERNRRDAAHPLEDND